MENYRESGISTLAVLTEDCGAFRILKAVSGEENRWNREGRGCFEMEGENKQAGNEARTRDLFLGKEAAIFYLITSFLLSKRRQNCPNFCERKRTVSFALQSYYNLSSGFCQSAGCWRKNSDLQEQFQEAEWGWDFWLSSAFAETTLSLPQYAPVTPQGNSSACPGNAVRQAFRILIQFQRNYRFQFMGAIGRRLVVPDRLLRTWMARCRLRARLSLRSLRPKLVLSERGSRWCRKEGQAAASNPPRLSALAGDRQNATGNVLPSLAERFPCGFALWRFWRCGQETAAKGA